MATIRVGMMGFGRVGRQIYRLALADRQFEVVAVSDIGQPAILHYLLCKGMDSQPEVRLENNYLVSPRGRTRLMPADHPTEIPWDVFGVDIVIDATGRFRSHAQLQPHLDNGAPRVMTSALPEGELDRVVLYGVNHATAHANDRVVSAGSASTTATALVLQEVAAAYAIEQATMTSVHAYTSDQSLQDYAGADFRRSRSGAENIIPNTTPARDWVQNCVPSLAGKFSAYALNVPVQVGSMLDVTIALQDASVSADDIKTLFEASAQAQPDLIRTTRDPIVSSDVRGSTQSVLVDLDGTMKAADSIIKVIGWHETLGHARRILDVAALYARLDAQRSGA